MKTPLEKLGLTDDNAGVFDGEWRGGGATIDKISPIDGRRLAGIRTASDDEPFTALAFKILTMPTFVVLKGGREVARQRGAQGGLDGLRKLVIAHVS